MNWLGELLFLEYGRSRIVDRMLPGKCPLMPILAHIAASS